MDRPVISVVMSTFNSERYLAEAIESILAQSFTDFEFIIINDGSTDESAALLDSYGKGDARVLVHHQWNRGLVESLNRGCILARGKYIARMDADDVADKSRLLWQVSFMEDHPEVAVVGGAIETTSPDGKVFAIESFPITNGEIRSSLLRGTCPFSHPAVVIRREALVSVGGYRPVAKHAEDYDLWSRIADRFELANLPAVVLKYRRHPNQVSIRQCQQQALGALAVRAAALWRRVGRPDPLELLSEITPDVLSVLGVTDAEQQSAVARAYVTTIRNMCDAGELSEAVQTIEVARALDWRQANRAVTTDFRLLIARMHWHQRRFARSLFTACDAVLRRPVTMARPLKPLLSRLQIVRAR